MSISYNMELIDVGARGEIFHALEYCQFEFFGGRELNEGGVIGYFKESGMRVLYSDHKMMDWQSSHAKSQPLTQSDLVEKWSIEARIAFFFINAFSDECISDIKNFVNRLSETTSCSFALSFEYEAVYAIKEIDTLRWLRSFGS